MAKLPFRKLKIGPHKWEVKFAPLNDEDTRGRKYRKELAASGKHATFFGEADFEATLIRLNSNLKEEILGEVLLHECLHVIIDECNLRKQIKAADEEQVVQCMAASLLQVFRDNPKLLDVITNKQK